MKMPTDFWRTLFIVAILLSTVGTQCQEEKGSAGQLIGPLMSEMNVSKLACKSKLPTAIVEPHFSLGFDKGSAPLLGGGGFSWADSIVPGRNGNALRPKAGYVRLPAKDVLNLDHGAVSLWVGLDEFDGSSTEHFRIIDSDTASGWTFALSRHANGNLQFFATDGTGPENAVWSQVAANSPAIPYNIKHWSQGEWHHVTVTWGAEKVRMYVDGRIVGDAPRGVYFPTAEKMPPNLYLLSSNRANNGFPANGKFRIDQFRSFFSEISSEQVASLYRSEIDSSGPEIHAGRLILRLSGQTDGFGLSDIVDSTDCATKTMLTPSNDLWQVKLRNSKKQEFTVSNRSTIGAKLKLEPKSRNGIVKVFWEGVALPDAGGLTVVVSFKPDSANNAIEAKMDVSLKRGTWSVQEVIFPKVSGIAPINENSSATDLLYPDYSIGRRIRNPFDLPARTTHYPSRHASMQWMGWYDREVRSGGTYLGIHDPKGNLKSFHTSPAIPIKLANSSTQKGMDVSVITYAENPQTPGNGLKITWPAVIAIQDGDWFDFAQRYRKFAVQQTWTAQGAITARPDVPGWLSKAGLINVGAFSEISLKLANELGSSGAPPGLILFHHIQWDATNRKPKKWTLINDVPFVTPLDSLDSTLKSAESAGVPVALYTIPGIWDAWYDPLGPDAKAQNNPWIAKNGELAAIRDEKGGISSVGTSIDPAGPFSNDAAWIGAVYTCPASSTWKNVFSTFVEQTASLYPVSGFYLDVVPAYEPRRCYSEVHGHSAGGGSYWTAGYRSLLSEARSIMKQYRPDGGFYGESFSEPHIDTIDGFLIWDMAAGEPLPLAIVVYHDFTQFIGRYTPAEDSDVAKIVKQGQLFSWGGMVGFHTFPLDSSKYIHIKKYLLKLAQLRRKFQDYLVFGKMLRTPNVSIVTDNVGTAPIQIVASSVNTMPVPELNVPSYNAEGTLEQLQTNAIVASAWKSPGGKTGILVMSLDPSQTEKITIYVPLNASHLEISQDAATIKVIKLNQEINLGVLKFGSSEVAVQLELEALDVALIEVNGI